MIMIHVTDREISLCLDGCGVFMCQEKAVFYDVEWDVWAFESSVVLLMLDGEDSYYWILQFIVTSSVLFTLFFT